MQRKGVSCRYLIVNGLRAASRKSPEKQTAVGCSFRAVRMFLAVIPATEISVGKAAKLSVLFGKDLFAVE